MMLILMFSCCFLMTVGGSQHKETERDLPFGGRIIGGQPAVLRQFPYQVSLRTFMLQSHFCGGFIITDHWLGSAAHCTKGRSPWNFVAVLGASSRTHEGTTMTIAKCVNHPDYENKNLRNDIALIKTERKIIFSNAVHPVQFGSVYVEGGIRAIASGWGYTSNPGEAAANLQWTEVSTLSNEECRRQLSKSNAAKVFDSSICAEVVRSEGGACLGDSGGPLVADNVLVGIISWGVPCALGFPDVYTRITSYHGWIDSVIDF